MSELATTSDRIIAATERRMREGGFHGFSFREIAADVGIKSASVHHHFPTKEDLAVAVARAYTERHMGSLGDPHDLTRAPRQLFGHFIDLFRRDISDDERMCLCGLLGTETGALPPRVSAEVQAFFRANVRWLEVVLARAVPQAAADEISAKAHLVTASLEGAVLMALCLDEIQSFDSIAHELERLFDEMAGQERTR